MLKIITKEHRIPLKIPRRHVGGWSLFSNSNVFQPDNQFLGDVYSFSDYQCGPSYGIPPHPHELFEILCIQLGGIMHFVDNIGNDRVTTTGSVHHFSSSTGYIHSAYAEGGEPLRFISIWVKPPVLPARPRYQQRSLGPEQFGKNRFRVLFADEASPQEGALSIPANIRVSACEVDGGETETCVGKDSSALLYVCDGTLCVNGIDLEEGDHLRIEGRELLQISGSPAGRCILVEIPQPAPA